LTSPLNIVFAGTPDFAADHLQALIDSRHNVVAVYSQPDRPAGRGKKLQASAVKQTALAHNISVFQPESLKTPEAQQQLADISADVMIVVAYGLILPQAILDTPKHGCLNVHGSLLPKWRGAAPIQRAVWAGDKETGITVMQMDKGLDTGAMLMKKALAIEDIDNSASLYQKLAIIGPQALLETLDNLNNIEPEKQQDNLATYAHKLTKQEAKMDWQLSAAQLVRNVRAFNPWPTAHFEVHESGLKVLQAKVVTPADTLQNAVPGQVLAVDKNGILVATSDQAILLEIIQLPGKKPLPVKDILNGRADWFNVGTVLL
jgi:methionyl-tRNA formyltransferase